MLCSFMKLIYPSTRAAAESGSYMVGLYRLHDKVTDASGAQIKEAKVVGYYLPTTAGLRFDMTGHWIKGKYGVQYELSRYHEVVVPGREGTVAYLASGLIRGIGPVTAERIYDTFGEETLSILDSKPEKLLAVPGISKNKLKRISESYLASRSAREVVGLLAPHGVTAKRAVKIYKEFGYEAMTIIRQYPYRLCEMHGVGFRTADSIAKSLGIHPLSAGRIMAGLLYTLEEAETQGHLCLPIKEFVPKCVDLLETPELTAEYAAMQAYQLFTDGKIAVHQNHVYREKTAHAEQAVANRIQALRSQGRIHIKADLDAEIAKEETALGITLAPEQRQAVKCCLTERICIVSGGPGTGKTLIQKVFLNIYDRLHPRATVTCCAPTGRAARRMAECTGRPAFTIHKALRIIGGDDEEESEPPELDSDLVLADEVSMLDIHLAVRLLNALPQSSQLVLVGDADQLPSVGPGAVLSELIACGTIPVIFLDKVFRQDAGSRVATNAALIRHNETALDYGEDFVFHESADLSASAALLERLYINEVSRVGLDHVALLTPYRVKTETGVNALNERLRDKINPASPDKPEAAFVRKLFRLGDKVMHIKNRDDISNGDIGYITQIDKQDGETTVVVDFGDERIAEYEGSELGLLELAYATTVHKSQGSEYHTVLINLQSAHFVMLKRPLIYTAITRAKQRVILVGERKALHIAIKKLDAEKRNTRLAARINEPPADEAVNQ